MIRGSLIARFFATTKRPSGLLGLFISRPFSLLAGVSTSMAMVLFCSGCASSSGIKNVMLPLTVVRKIVMDNLPGGVKKESMNGREITSEYFDAKDIDVPSETARERAKAVITVLGSRRPYTVNVVVTREKREKGSKKKYDKLGEDDRLTKDVKKRIKDALDNRPADLNVIDDFRAF